MTKGPLAATFAFAAAAILAIVPAVSASAATASYNYTATATGWQSYGPVRISTLTDIKMQPNNLFNQDPAGSVTFLQIRLASDVGGSAISAAQSWTNSTVQKNVMTGLAIGTSFRVQASGYVSGGDSSWGGTLTF